MRLHDEPIGCGHGVEPGSKRGPCNGGGGGGSSSSSSSTSTSTTNVDKRQVVDSNSVGVSSDSSTVNVSVLDQGAFQKAVDLAKSSNDNFTKGLVDLMGLAKDSLDLSSKAANTIGDAYKNSADSATGVRSIAVIGLVIAGVVALAAYSKGK